MEDRCGGENPYRKEKSERLLHSVSTRLNLNPPRTPQMKVVTGRRFGLELD